MAACFKVDHTRELITEDSPTTGETDFFYSRTIQDPCSTGSPCGMGLAMRD